MYENYRALAAKARAHCLHMVYIGQSGHIGSMLSAADIMAVLYEGILRVDPKNPKWPERDRFLLSKGHAGALVYAVLAEKGFFPMEWLDTYDQNDGKLLGHVSHYVPGVEVSSGSLGHGMSIACGMAKVAKEKQQSHRVFVMTSDGDLNEGSSWEAIMFAGQHHLDNLVAIVDYNRLQALGFSKDICDLGDLSSRVEPFGWSCVTIDGHDYGQIEAALKNVPLVHGKPTMIICNTIKGKSVSFMENQVHSHYWHVGDEDLDKAMKELAGGVPAEIAECLPQGVKA